jgi:predicted MFS family arabinose efflux permease
VSYRTVAANGEFRCLWAAHVLSVAGDQLARVALTVLVFNRTTSAGLAALTYALTYLPDLFGGAVLAHLADRYPRRTVMVVADLARAIVITVIAIPGLPLPAQATLLVLAQVLAGPFQSARQAVLPDILDGDALTVGQGVLDISYQAGLAVGLGAGAAAVLALGTSGALLVDAATFVVSACVLRWGLGRHPSSLGESHERPGQWATIAAGWRVVAHDSQLRALLAIVCCSGFYVVPEGLAVPLAAQFGGTGTLGWLLAANPVGTVLGVLVLNRLRPDRRLRWLGPLAVVTSLVLIPTGWTASVPIVVALWTVSGAGSAHDVMTKTQYVRIAPVEHRGQAVGVAIAALRSAQGAGIVAAGFVAQAVLPAHVIAGAAVLGVLAGAMAAWSWARARSRANQPMAQRPPHRSGTLPGNRSGAANHPRNDGRPGGDDVLH